MTITRIEPGERLSQASAHAGLVFLTGQVGAPGDSAEAQTRTILEAIDRLLAAAGSDKSRILHATVWLADIADFAAMNRAWDAWVDRRSPPSRSTCEARMVAPDYLVEITVTAAV